MRPRAHKNAWIGPARVSLLALAAGALARAPLAFPQPVPPTNGPPRTAPPRPVVAPARALPAPPVQPSSAPGDEALDPWIVPVRLLAGDDDAWRLDALTTLALALRVRTSIEAAPHASLVPPDAGSIFAAPLLFWSARDGVDIPQDVRAALAQFVAHGGLLVIDGAAGQDAAFLAQAEAVLVDALPAGASLAPLAAGDILLHTFYLLPHGGDDLRVARVGREARVVFSRAGLLGQIAHGDDTSRESATRLLINVVMYALCLDYKDDQVHAPFLMRRRRGAP